MDSRGKVVGVQGIEEVMSGRPAVTPYTPPLPHNNIFRIIDF